MLGGGTPTPKLVTNSPLDTGCCVAEVAVGRPVQLAVGEQVNKVEPKVK